LIAPGLTEPPSAAGAERGTPLLRATGLTKSFPGLRALDAVSLELHSGEIVAVVGQNGSGKSTLVKILAGVYEADEGSIEVHDGAGNMVTARAAAGELHFIHQDLGLVPMLNTIENLDLSRELGRRGLIPAPRRAEQRRAEQLIKRFGAAFDVRVPVSNLSAAERTIVAIARSLDRWTRTDNVLILDEPTAALAGAEVDRLFEAVRRVAASGGGVIFISHRLDEVLALADRVMALRDGRVVADVKAGEFDHDALVRMITGRQLANERFERASAPGAPVLAARGLAGATVKRADFTLRAGEIVGISGLLGSGREHVCGLLFGALQRRSGAVEVAGQALRSGDARAAIAAGVGFVPSDRHKEGLVLEHSVRENLTLPRLRTLRRTMYRLDRRAERLQVADWVARLTLRPPQPERPVKLFSGGNQQKIVLAKWLRNDPRVLLLDEPTQGVDVGAKAAIHELLNAAAGQGAGVLVSSSETKELTILCDRVLVMRDGVIANELEGASLTEERLVREGLGLAVHADGQAAQPAREQSDA
jgi:ABC-type sugar transport system ATPase subunit